MIRFTVPATSANLGPGFDTLGLALGLRNTVTLEQNHAKEFRLHITGEGADALSAGKTNLMRQAMEAVFAETGPYEGPYKRIRMHNTIPMGSGLGSSASAIVAGVMAANLISSQRLPADELLRIAVSLENHPDNVAAALFGGLTIASAAGSNLLVRRVPIKPMVVAVALPQVATSTVEQRAALPTDVPLTDAAYSIGRALLVVEALREGDLRLLGDAIIDRLHVPVRSQAIPAYSKVVDAATAAGAAAVTISGAGPAVIAFAERGLDKIAQAMFLAFRTAGVTARTWSLPIAEEGFRMEPTG